MSRGKSLGAVYARAAGRRVPDLAGLLGYRGLSRNARLLLNDLYRAADNYGNFFAGKGTVAEYLYPDGEVSYDEVAGWLEELGAAGLVYFYAVDGRRFLHLVEWVERERGAVIVPLAPHQGGGDGVSAGDFVSRSAVGASAEVADNEQVQDVRQVGGVLSQEVDVVDGLAGFCCAEVAPSRRADSPSSPPEPPSPPTHAYTTRGGVDKGSRFVKELDELGDVDVVERTDGEMGYSKDEVMAVMRGCFWGGKLQACVEIEAEAEAYMLYYASGRDARGRRVHSWRQKAADWLKNAQMRAAERAIKESKNGRSNGEVPIKARNL